MRVKMILSYCGTHYYGFQRQTRHKTIQGELEQVLSKILQEPITISGAGRTDAGVHALGQVAAFSTSKTVDLGKLRYSCNRLLEKEIHIVSMEEVEESFHPRMHVKSKVYEYHISMKEHDPFLYPFHLEFFLPLDIEKMKEAIPSMLGTHDFSYFTSKKEDKMNFIRTIYDVEIFSQKEELTLRFEGDGFMRYMVRLLVGALLEIGKGKEPVSFIHDHLDTSYLSDTCRYKAPAEGLYLMKVTYEEEEKE